MDKTLWIKGGRVIDPKAQRDCIDDLFSLNGKIVPSLSKDQKASAQIIKANGLVVSPGLVDLNVDVCEPGNTHKEDMASGTRAACAGGFTSILCKPTTNPPCDNIGAVQYVKNIIEQNAVINAYPTGAITKELEENSLAPIGSLQKAGAVAISNGTYSVHNNELMRRAVEYANMFNMVILDHCQDRNLSDQGVMNEGPISLRLGLSGWPNAAEDIIVSRNVILATYTKAHIHLQSVSSGNAVDIIRRAKQRGVSISAETTPHHLFFNDESLLGYNTNFKVTPPIRSEADRLSLIEGILDGTIDCIGSNHSPHVQDEKNVEFDLAPFGAIGLETSLSACLEILYHSKKANLATTIDLLSKRPAEIINLKKGNLSAGSDADICIFDPDEERLIDENSFFSKSNNSPWIGESLRGVVKQTIINGKLIYNNGNFLDNEK